MTHPFRFGIAGCGVIAPTHAAAIQQIAGAELLAATDVIPERMQALAEKFHIPRTFTGLQEMLACPELDAIAVCTPSGLHGEIAVQALQAGKHVVVEKPMEVTLEACDKMIAAAESTGKTLTVISQHRFDMASRIAKQAVEMGKLGRLVLAEASVLWYRTQSYYDSGDWRGTWQLDGGGALMNQGVHTVDLLQWLAGPVLSISASTRTAAHERIEVEDVATAALTFDGGAVGTLTATTAAYPGFAVRIGLYGTEGSLILEGDRLKEMRLKNGETFTGEEAAAHALSVARGGSASVREEAEKTGAASDPGALWGDSHRAQLQNFIEAAQTGAPLLIDGRAARRPVEIILGVYHSARSGKTIYLAG